MRRSVISFSLLTMISAQGVVYYEQQHGPETRLRGLIFHFANINVVLSKNKGWFRHIIVSLQQIGWCARSELPTTAQVTTKGYTSE